MYISSPNWRCPLLRVTGVTLRIAGPNVGCLRVPLKHKTLLGLYFALTTRFSSFYRKQLPRQVTGVPLPTFVGIVVLTLAIVGSLKLKICPIDQILLLQMFYFCENNPHEARHCANLSSIGCRVFRALTLHGYLILETSTGRTFYCKDICYIWVSTRLHNFKKT